MAIATDKTTSQTENQIPDLDTTEPVLQSTEVTYNISSCFGSGSISLTVQLDKDAFKAGDDSINMSAEVINQSNKNVQAISANIQETWTCISNIYEPTSLVFAMRGAVHHSVPARGSFKWDCDLNVPVTTPSYEDQKLKTKLSYVVQVTVFVSHAKNVVLDLPIKILKGPESLPDPEVIAPPKPVIEQSKPDENKNQTNHTASAQTRSHYTGAQHETNTNTDWPHSSNPVKPYPTTLESAYTHADPVCRRNSNSSYGHGSDC